MPIGGFLHVLHFASLFSPLVNKESVIGEENQPKQYSNLVSQRSQRVSCQGIHIVDGQVDA